MNIDPAIQRFLVGEEGLYFVTGISGFIMKELDCNSATVFCWQNARSANEFISNKFSEKQRQFYKVRFLNNNEFVKLRSTIKFLPDNAAVDVEFHSFVVESS